MDQPPLLVYIDGRSLRGIASCPGPSEELPYVAEGFRRIWRLFKEEHIRLITSRQETENEIILWLNGRGCCVTDTLVMYESVEEFAEWEGADIRDIEGYRRLTRLFEEIEFLQPLPREAGALFEIISEKIIGARDDHCPEEENKEERKMILHRCAESLQLWYTGDEWKKLRKTNYALNWRILASFLEGHGHGTEHKQEEIGKYLSVFGLLNRVVGLIKKSCPVLPVKEDHIRFIVDMVMNKYEAEQEKSVAFHLGHCIRHGIPLFLTVNEEMTRRFNERKEFLRNHPDALHGLPKVISPKDLEDIASARKRG